MSEDDLRRIVKQLYESKGYRVEDVHGRPEPAVDLIATKLDTAGKNPIETLGIQVTIQKGDKSRVENAAFALHRTDIKFSYFVIIATGEYTADFHIHLNQIDSADKVICFDGDRLEKELLRQNIIPDSLLEKLEQQFYESKLFGVLLDITNCLFENGYLSELKSVDSVLSEVDSRKGLIMENMTLVIKGLEAASDASSHTYMDMLDSYNKNDFGLFYDAFLRGQPTILRHVLKVQRAFRTLSEIQAVLKLLWYCLSATERAILRQLGPLDRAKEFWLFQRFDPEFAIKYGHQIVFLQIFDGISHASTVLKNRTDKAIEIIEDKPGLRNEFERIMRHDVWCKKDEKTSNANSQT